jgi:hypothetical protein
MLITPQKENEDQILEALIKNESNTSFKISFKLNDDVNIQASLLKNKR